MKALELTGSTSYQNKDIKIDCQKLLIVFHSTVGYLSATPTIDIQLSDGGESTEIVPNATPILHLMEFAQAKEGFIRNINAGSDYFTKGCIDLTYDGAIKLGGNRFLTLNIAGVAAGDTVTIYAINDNVEANHVIHYDRQRVGSGIEKQNVQTLGKQYLLLTQSGLDKIRMNYATGRTEELENAELLVVGDDANDIVAVTQTGAGTTAQYGTLNLFIQSLVTDEGEPNVVNCQLLTNGSNYTYYLVSIKPLGE